MKFLKHKTDFVSHNLFRHRSLITLQKLVSMNSKNLPRNILQFFCCFSQFFFFEKFILCMYIVGRFWPKIKPYSNHNFFELSENESWKLLSSFQAQCCSGCWEQSCCWNFGHHSSIWKTSKRVMKGFIHCAKSVNGV